MNRYNQNIEKVFEKVVFCLDGEGEKVLSELFEDIGAYSLFRHPNVKNLPLKHVLRVLDLENQIVV